MYMCIYMYICTYKLKNTHTHLYSSVGKVLPAVQEIPVRFLGQEDPLKKEYAKLVKNPPVRMAAI